MSEPTWQDYEERKARAKLIRQQEIRGLQERAEKGDQEASLRLKNYAPGERRTESVTRHGQQNPRAAALAREIPPMVVEGVASMLGSSLLGPAGAARPVASLMSRLPGLANVARAERVGEGAFRVGGAALGGAAPTPFTHSDPTMTGLVEGGAEAASLGIESGIRAVNRRYMLLPRLYRALRGRDPRTAVGSVEYLSRVGDRGTPTLGQVSANEGIIRIESLVENVQMLPGPGSLRQGHRNAQAAIRADVDGYVDAVLRFRNGRVLTENEVADVVNDAVSNSSKGFRAMETKKYAVIDGMANRPQVDGTPLLAIVDRIKKKRILKQADAVGTAALEDISEAVSRGPLTFEQAKHLKGALFDLRDTDSILATRGQADIADMMRSIDEQMDASLETARPDRLMNPTMLKVWRDDLRRAYHEAKAFSREGHQTFGDDFMRALIRKEPKALVNALIPTTGSLSADRIIKLRSAMDAYRSHSGVMSDAVMGDLQGHVLTNLMERASGAQSTLAGLGKGFPARKGGSEFLDGETLLTRIKDADKEKALTTLLGAQETENLKLLANSLMKSQETATQRLVSHKPGRGLNVGQIPPVAAITSGIAMGAGTGLAVYIAGGGDKRTGAASFSLGGAAALGTTVVFGPRALVKILQNRDLLALVRGAAGTPGAKTTARAASRLMMRLPFYFGVGKDSDVTVRQGTQLSAEDRPEQRQ